MSVQEALIVDAQQWACTDLDDMGLPHDLTLYTLAFYNGILLATREPEIAGRLLRALGRFSMGAVAMQDQWLARWRDLAGARDD